MGNVLVENALVLFLVKMWKRLVAARGPRLGEHDVIVLQQENRSCVPGHNPASWHPTYFGRRSFTPRFPAASRGVVSERPDRASRILELSRKAMDRARMNQMKCSYL